MPSLIPSHTLATQKPRAEVLVEGELSPFEDESLYRILRKSFQIEHPSYTQLLDEDLATRVNVNFRYSYSNALFNDVLQEGWRDLKELFKQIAHRRGRAGAAFTITFLNPGVQLIFKMGNLNERELASALDQIGHLTSIVGQILGPETMQTQLERVETTYDKKSDRWRDFSGYGSKGEYFFDESRFRWVQVVK